MDARDILIRPLITEKSTQLMEEGKYVFVVAKKANKIEIAKALGRTRPNRYLDESMRRLIAADEVAYTLPEKPNSRLQKYRLTEKGKARLSRMGNE